MVSLIAYMQNRVKIAQSSQLDCMLGPIISQLATWWLRFSQKKSLNVESEKPKSCKQKEAQDDRGWTFKCKTWITARLNHQNPKRRCLSQLGFFHQFDKCMWGNWWGSALFVEKTATPSILRRSLDSTLHLRISWWFTTSKNLCQASYIREKSISVTPWPFTMTSPGPLLRFMLLTRAETRRWTVMSVSVLASCQTQFCVFVSSCLRPLLVSGFCCLSHPSNAGAAQILWLVLLSVPYCNLRLAQLFVRLKSRTCKTMGRVCSLWWKINVTIYFGLISSGEKSWNIWWPLLLLGKWLHKNYYKVPPSLHQCWWSHTNLSLLWLLALSVAAAVWKLVINYSM